MLVNTSIKWSHNLPQFFRIAISTNNGKHRSTKVVKNNCMKNGRCGEMVLVLPRRALNFVMTAQLLGWGNKVLAAEFYELESSGGVKCLDIRDGSGPSPRTGDKVVIHYTGRLAAKQGWRFDSTYEHKDKNGIPIPFDFALGSGTVISGLDAAVRTMKTGGIRRVIIPPSQGYQNRSQEPVPPNIFDRQRLFTTIFNPTRLSNGETSTLGTIVFDIELLSVRPL